MKKGDILLIDYKYDIIGFLIKLTSKSKYNHAAWAVNEFSVIEAASTSVKITPVSKYFNKFLYKVKLVQLQNLTKSQINKITKDLLSKRGKVSYWKSLVSFFLVGFKLKGLVPNCSNIIFNSMQKSDYTMTKKNRYYITPEDFNSAKYAIDITSELPKGTNHGLLRRLYGKICSRCSCI